MRKAVVAYLVVLHLTLIAGVGLWASKHWQRQTVPVAEHPYYKARRSFQQVVQVPAGATVFAGDSLTDHADWSILLGDARAVNFGIAGDTSDGLLQRVDDITRHQPARVFLMIGINDVSGHVAPEVILANYRQILQRIHATSPGTQVVVQSVLPVSKWEALNAPIRRLNAQLQAVAAQQGAGFLDLHSAFTDASGKLDARYTFDGLHLNGEGYLLWRQLLAAPPALASSS